MVPRSWPLCTLSLCTAALLFAPLAGADPADDAFIGALTQNGIPVADRDSATVMAQAICDGFDHHQKPSMLALKLMKQSGLSLKQASYVVGVAISAYCPEYVGHTDDSVRWLYPLPPLS
jgi:Protein of unknown function (DUF732)